MKKIVITILVIFSFSANLNAATNNAISIYSVIDAIKNDNLKYLEHKLLFGFNSIHSCLYVGNKVIILKHYCYPKMDYPAKGYKIISTDFGVVDLYEEHLPNGKIKRDIIISTFSETLKPNLNFSMNEVSFKKVNVLVESLYYQRTPACWSTNYSFSEQMPQTNCSVENVVNSNLWFTETQDLINDSIRWNDLLAWLDQNLNRPPTPIFSVVK